MATWNLCVLIDTCKNVVNVEVINDTDGVCPPKTWDSTYTIFTVEVESLCFSPIAFSTVYERLAPIWTGWHRSKLI